MQCRNDVIKYLGVVPVWMTIDQLHRYLPQYTTQQIFAALDVLETRKQVVNAVMVNTEHQMMTVWAASVSITKVIDVR